MRADQALAVGILDEVVDADKLSERAINVAQSYAALPPKTYAMAKRQLRQETVQRIETAMKNGANTPKGGWFSDETKPAMKAMVTPK